MLFEGARHPPGGFPAETEVWMSRWDRVLSPPPGFTVTARGESGTVAAFESPGSRVSAVAFLPEAPQCPGGADILSNFLFGVCRCRKAWDLGEWVDTAVEEVKRTVGDGRVVCGLSGGVDSTVAAVIPAGAVGDRLGCIRQQRPPPAGQAEQVLETTGDPGARVH